MFLNFIIKLIKKIEADVYIRFIPFPGGYAIIDYDRRIYLIIGEPFKGFCSIMLENCGNIHFKDRLRLAELIAREEFYLNHFKFLFLEQLGLHNSALSVQEWFNKNTKEMREC